MLARQFVGDRVAHVVLFEDSGGFSGESLC